MAAEPVEIKISLTGLEETLKALKQYDPEARKQLIDAMKSASNLIRDDAKRKASSISVPSGWRKQVGMPKGEGAWKGRLTRGGKGWPPWEVNNIKRRIKSSIKAKRTERHSIITSRGQVRNTSGEGAIYEFAKKSHRSQNYPWVNSLPFVNHLGSMKGGRLIWSSYEQRKDQVRTQIFDALAVANAKLQTRFDSVKEGDR